jgi:hypothetical protein
LSNDVYRTGIEKIENALTDAEARDETLVFRTELSIHMMMGYKPVLEDK